MKSQWLKSMANVFIILIIALTSIWLAIAQPTSKKSEVSVLEVDSLKLQKHVEKLSMEFYPRNFLEIDNLNKTAAYIKKHLEMAGGLVEFQEYQVSDQTYRNVIAIFGRGKGNKLIIGAHYDSHELTPGADDNASGISGLIELAYLLQKFPIDREIELVAYTLEEPPYFRTEYMGSYRHAEKISKESQIVHGMISLEMIGYFSGEPNSQNHPNKMLKLIYPSTGNFIALVGSLDQMDFTKKIKLQMKGATNLPVYSINAPKSLPGIDYSDHLNYWNFGINAVMISDTAFYRNSEYHELGDTSDRLDYDKMSKVVVAVYETIKSL